MSGCSCRPSSHRSSNLKSRTHCTIMKTVLEVVLLDNRPAPVRERTLHVGTAVNRGLPMATTTIDRRVARTRAMLHEALLSLIAEKRYETITVEEICERANTARSTFYAHYTDKDDLMRSGFKTLRKTILGRHNAISAR